MKISICIGCVDKHIKLLHKLLNSFDKFTRKPDEIIISLSPKFLNLDLNIDKKNLEESFKKYNLTCLVQNKITSCAENLNKCFELVTGDIIILADADDVIHPQKCEISEFIFDKYPKTKLLLHGFLDIEPDYSLSLFPLYDKKNIEIFNDLILGEKDSEYSDRFKKIRLSSHKYFNKYKDLICKKYANGPCIISNDVVKSIKFENIHLGEDTKFVATVFQKYKNTIVILENLISYRESRSWANVKRWKLRRKLMKIKE